MLHEISLRLAKQIEKKRRKEKLRRDLMQVKQDLHLKSAHLETLAARLAKEKIDVKKLERLGLTAVFYTILGSREEQLVKERQEVLKAELMYRQTRHQVEYLQGEEKMLERQLQDYTGVEAEYETLLQEKERLIRDPDQPDAAVYLARAEEIAHLEAQEKEVREAVRVGTHVLDQLDEIIQVLFQAERWGTWDMLGGGVLATAVKRARIDEARGLIHQIQAGLSQFNRELQDVQREVSTQLEMSSFDTFADYLMDGLIFDWVIQSRIRESLARVRETRERIAELIAKLKSTQTEVSRRRREIIETA
jgi:hypothetical protein